MKPPVAFFDIDGTVFRSSLLIELMEALIKADVFDPAVRLEYMSDFTAWRNREGTYDTYIGAVIRSYLTHIKGVPYGTVADVGRAMVAEHGKHVYRYSRDLLGSLKADGYYTVAISQSPKTILDDFCQQYGFDKVYGRLYEIGPTDRLTGEIIDEHLIANKANIVKRVFESGTVIREGAVAVGDTDGDIPMLEMVDGPICFNPNQVLYDQAKQRDWEVIVERKDVIYKV